MRGNGRSRSALRFLLPATLLWMGVIFWFSARNAADSSIMSSGLLHALLKICVPHWEQRSFAEQEAIHEALHTLFRKCGHFSEFAVLGILLLQTLRHIPKLNPIRRQKHPAAGFFALSALLALLYACSDEFHQRFVPGRSCELRDVCIDFAGACCGMLICMLCGRLLRRIRQHRQASSAENGGINPITQT